MVRGRGDRVARRYVAGLLAVQAALLAWSAWRNSPTLNEPGHLAAGISHWQFGRFELYRVNPPPVRMVAALPVLAAGVETTWDGVHYAPGERPMPVIGAHLARRNGMRIFWLMTLARWACIPLILGGGLVCFLWARELYGRTAGLLAIGLWTFSPNLLGHGALITTDAAAAAMGVTAAYAFWRWLGDPCWSLTLLAGIALGVAALTKFTLLVFYPLWPILWIIYRRPYRSIGKTEDEPGWMRQAGRLAVVMAVSLWVINVGYGFEGSMTPLGKFKFVSALFKGEPRGAPGSRFEGSWLGLVPVPVPEDFLLGIDVQRRDFERYGSPSYLRGRFRSHGWWYYYVYGLMVKMPLAMWGLIGMAVVSMTPPRLASSSKGPADRSAGDRQDLSPPCRGDADPALASTLASDSERAPAVSRGPVRVKDQMCVFLPLAAILVLVSSQTGFGEHVRYVFPILPFLFVWVSRSVLLTSYGGAIKRDRRAGKSVLRGGAFDRAPLRAAEWFLGKPWSVSAADVLLPSFALWFVLSSLHVYPHSLSYFNELAGGPRGGAAHLLHSNIDWGQDLLYLKRWLDRHPKAQPMYVEYFGPFSPDIAGIDFPRVPRSPSAPGTVGGPAPPEDLGPGWYAVSVNYVRGYPFHPYEDTEDDPPLMRDALAYFRRFEPVDMAGYSIYIYRLEEDDVTTGANAHIDPMRTATW